MKTKFTVLIAGCLLAFTALNAQTTFGLRAGVNFQNLNGDDTDGDKLDNNLKTGFHIGANVEFPVAPDFFLQPGVLYSMKGAKGDNDTNISLSYIEVPVNFLYKPMLGTGKLLLGFGPYVGFGIGGKADYGDSEVDVEFENEITATQAISGTPYFKGFDAGANLLFGYEFSNKISAQVNAQLGLVNIYPDIEDFPESDAKVKNTGFGISVGYRF